MAAASMSLILRRPPNLAAIALAAGAITSAAGAEPSFDMTPIRFGRVGARTLDLKTPIEEIQMSAQRCYKSMPFWLLLGISAAGAPTISQAEVHVDSTAAAVHVTTNKDAIPDVLSAFETPFNLRYHTSVPLSGNVSSVYSGSLTHVGATECVIFCL
jgi:hypothetical protein